MQVDELFNDFDLLQKEFGDTNLNSIYGCGCVNKPGLMLIFMNPTGKNISANLSWNGIRAPWLGTKNVWKLLFNVGLINLDLFSKTQNFKLVDWTEDFCSQIYSNLANNGVYITNLAKCTQLDARPLKSDTFRRYLDLIEKEIEIINPIKIITFGNQVSSVFLGKNITVSNYNDKEFETKIINGENYQVYPVFYPVGQGMRNMPKAVDRINLIIKHGPSSINEQKMGNVRKSSN